MLKSLFPDPEAARGLEYANHPDVETIVVRAAWYAYFVEPEDRYSYHFDDGEPIYKDGAHLRPSYVKENIHFLDDLVLPQS